MPSHRHAGGIACEDCSLLRGATYSCSQSLSNNKYFSSVAVASVALLNATSTPSTVSSTFLSNLILFVPIIKDERCSLCCKRKFFFRGEKKIGAKKMFFSFQGGVPPTFLEKILVPLGIQFLFLTLFSSNILVPSRSLLLLSTSEWWLLLPPLRSPSEPFGGIWMPLSCTRKNRPPIWTKLGSP